MNLSYFIARRISRGNQQGFSSTLHKIAIVSIGIGLGASIVSFLIMKGFQETVKNKIFGFSGHLTITRFTMNNSTEEQPVNYHMDIYDKKEQYPFIDHIQEYAHKTGLIKTEDEVLGVVLKGVGKSFDTTAFRSNMLAGSFVHFPDSGYANQVVISKTIANKLKANIGDKITVHFFQNPPRLRRLTITGIYETNLSEYYDSRVIIGDIRLIQRLNDWPDSLAGGLEIFVKKEYDVPEVQARLEAMMDEDLEKNFDKNVEAISDKYMQVFEWLNLLSRQVNILLGIILSVVCVNMISIVLILVMERTQMIGVLKALGSKDTFIRSIFVYQGVSLVLKGLLLGNIIGLGLCYLQYKFRFITLNPHDYYMSFVPISWHWEIVLLLNVLTLSLVVAVLLLPTMVIARVNPIKAIRFD